MCVSVCVRREDMEYGAGVVLSFCMGPLVSDGRAHSQRKQIQPADPAVGIHSPLILKKIFKITAS